MLKGNNTISGISHQKQLARPTMKKYYQLALVIISCVSVVTLLFYRHEYNRLRYVLEVLNFFGKPGVQNTFTTNDCIFHNSSFQHRKLNFEDPLPTWQRLTDDHFVYSAFWEVVEGDGRVKAVSVGFSDVVPNFACSLWYEDREGPLVGRFSFTKLETKDSNINKSKLSGYYLICRGRDVSRIPYGVTFYKTDIVPFKAFIHVQYSNEIPPLTNTTAICITAPPSPGLSKATIAEFLSYHQLVGVTEYIIYDGGLSNMVLSSLRGPAIRNGLGLSVSILPWNFPFPSHVETVTRLIIEKDCLSRTAGKVHNVAILSWDEYVVPKYHHLLASMLDDFDSGRKTTAKFEIPMIKFCKEFPDDEKAEPASPLVFRKTRYSNVNSNEHPFYFYRPHLISGSRDLGALMTQRVSQGIAAVHRYTSCSQDGEVNEKTHLYEPAMLRFSGDLKRSKLLNAWSSGRLFI
ncbi:hypothetical protein L9F63_023014 [Diploptera punctata]|uniref:Glycosyltransferase family 92 protein n=1 Tax=Diploptera punctata TaxID=6984 RepID=A0AAD7ZLN2_DIPPU|nr:hypothetical protein L9F63_023014 [Diploptera punctata]